MLSEPLLISCRLLVQKSAATVFEAIVDPEKMKNYFIAKGSERMEEGQIITWQFPEFDLSFPIEVKKVIPNESIEYTWSDPQGAKTTVTIKLESTNAEETFITITEGTKEPTPEGLLWLQRNTEGWANFLACLKAWLQYGINLRKGAFHSSQMPVETSTG